MVLNLFDTHINLHGEIYDEDRNYVLERARNEGVHRFISICDKLENFDQIHELSNEHEDMWCSVGVHPHYAKDYADLAVTDLIARSEHAKVCAIGETGLDQHYGYSDVDSQVISFLKHIEASQITGLPIIIHSRDADILMGDMLETAMKKRTFQPLMHCYTSSMELAQRALDLGAYFSVSGILSFKKAQDVRDVIKIIPLEKIILETDCPYLAPTPYRGRRNEPAYLVSVCDALAKLFDLSLEETAEITTQNALRLFGRVS